MSEAKGTATLSVDGKTIDLPVLGGSIGPKVIDVRKLYAETGHFTYDPGFTSTAACDSEITYIDGGKGELLHRAGSRITPCCMSRWLISIGASAEMRIRWLLCAVSSERCRPSITIPRI